MDTKFKENFSSIDEELAWQFFKMNGNPYIIQEIVKERNLEREKLRNHDKEM